MTYPDGMNRAARRRAAREARRSGAPVPAPPAQQPTPRREPGFMTIEHGQDHKNVSCRKLTDTVVDQSADTVTINSVAVEDTIHPVELVSG